VHRLSVSVRALGLQAVVYARVGRRRVGLGWWICIRNYSVVVCVRWVSLFLSGRTHLASSTSGTKFVELRLIVRQQKAHGAPSLVQLCPLSSRQVYDCNLQTTTRLL